MSFKRRIWLVLALRLIMLEIVLVALKIYKLLVSLRHGADQSNESDDRTDDISLIDQVETYPEENRQFAVAVQYRIVQGSECGTHFADTRNLSVHHVEQSGKQDDAATPADIVEITSFSFHSGIKEYASSHNIQD